MFATAVTVVPLDRESKGLSLKAFHDKYSVPSRPVLIESAASEWPAVQNWDYATLHNKCGDRMLNACNNGQKLQSAAFVKVHKAEAQGPAWGGMEAVDLAQHNLTTLGSLLATWDVGAGASSTWYLHDASVDILCRELFEDIRVPGYFAMDLKQALPRPLRHLHAHECHGSQGGGLGSGANAIHPSLFMSHQVKGALEATGSGLHTDGEATRFWMAVLNGTKTFRLVDPKSLSPGYEELYPFEENGKDILFPAHFQVDIFAPDYARHPKLRGARVFEVNVTKGDVIFIPEGWPHAVLNQGPSLAVTYNYVDEQNLEHYREYLKQQIASTADGAGHGHDPGSPMAELAEQEASQSGLRYAWLHATLFQDQLRAAKLGLSEDLGSSLDVTWRQFFHRNTPNASWNEQDWVTEAMGTVLEELTEEQLSNMVPSAGLDTEYDMEDDDMTAVTPEELDAAIQSAQEAEARGEVAHLQPRIMKALNDMGYRAEEEDL